MVRKYAQYVNQSTREISAERKFNSNCENRRFDVKTRHPEENRYFIVADLFPILVRNPEVMENK